MPMEILYRIDGKLDNLETGIQEAQEIAARLLKFDDTEVTIRDMRIARSTKARILTIQEELDKLGEQLMAFYDISEQE